MLTNVQPCKKTLAAYASVYIQAKCINVNTTIQIF